MRGATSALTSSFPIMWDFNPRAPCGARLETMLKHGHSKKISIHAPHAGRDPESTLTVIVAEKFQSTRPMRGATVAVTVYAPVSVISIHAPHAGRDLRPVDCSARTRHFNPRAPCGARPSAGVGVARVHNISIHAPHAGRDHRTPGRIKRKAAISIHAPHAGRDRPCFRRSWRG